MFLILLNTEVLVPGTKINIHFVYVVSSIVEKFTSVMLFSLFIHNSFCQKGKILTTYNTFKNSAFLRHLFQIKIFDKFWKKTYEDTAFHGHLNLKKHKQKKIFLIYKEFRRIGFKSYIWLPASSMGKNLCISSYIRKPFLIYDFAPDPIWISLYIWGKFSFLFISAEQIHFLTNTKK